MQMDLDRIAAGPDCSNYTDSPSCTGAARGCKWTTQCDEVWSIAKLTPLCHPCTLAFAARSLFVMKVMDDFQLPDPNNDRRNAEFAVMLVAYTVNGVCSTDLQDNFCMVKLQQQANDFSCAGMTSFLTNVGCCAPSVLDFQQGLCNVDKTLHPATSTCQTKLDAVNAEIAMCPNLKLGKTCAALKYLLVHQAIVSGIAPQWFAIQANKDALVAELKKVIAYAIGIDIALIIDLKIAAATANTGRRLLQTGDLQATTTITVQQYGASKSATQGLTGELDPLGVSDAVQATTPGGNLAQPTITGQSVTNIAVLPGSNDASSATPMLALAVACIFFV